MSARYTALALLMLLLPALSGCGYRFAADGGSRLDSGQKVWVAYFKNDTIYPQTAIQLKRALFEQFSAMRGISPAASREEGDLIIDGVVTGYGLSVVSYSATDTAKEYRLVVSADVTVRKKGDKPDSKPLWKGSVSARHDFVAETVVEMQRNREEAALASACRKLAQQVLWGMEQNY